MKIITKGKTMNEHTLEDMKKYLKEKCVGIIK
jgi:hypothetical protein